MKSSDQSEASDKIEIKETEPKMTRSISKDDSWIENANHLNRSMSGPDCLIRLRTPQSPEFECNSITSNDMSTASENPEVVIRRAAKTGSTAIRRRPGKRRSRTKIKRRCSINGHFYDRETSFFTPPHGCQTSVWVSSLVNTQEVINLMLEKYKVESDPRNFALFVVRDNGGKFLHWNTPSVSYCPLPKMRSCLLRMLRASRMRRWSHTSTSSVTICLKFKIKLIFDGFRTKKVKR